MTKNIQTIFKERQKANKIISIILLFISINCVCYGQSHDLGSWNIVNIKYNIDKKWSTFGEAQLRSLMFYNSFHYYEYKIGLNYKVHPSVKLTFGAGKYDTYKEGGNFILPKNNDEFRLWQQIVFVQSISKLKIEQRYRAEFRFTSKGYRNRFRYRLGASYPFGKKKNGYQPYQVSASNELFFTDSEPYFERNRILLALDYKTSKTVSLQIGYLHQFDYKINDETGRDFLLIGLFLELSHKNHKNSSHEIELKDH